jgi:hypothetical protein
MSELTKDEFLARCANAYDAGLCTPERLALLSAWVDAVLRYEGAELGGQYDQMYYFRDFMDVEASRLVTREDGKAKKTLAADEDGYALVQLAAILHHPCQLCATDRNAWWTRFGFCEHKDVRK